MERMNFSSGTVWEKEAGYSRAVKIGPFLEVSGTTAIDEHGHLVGDKDAFEQTRFILEKIRRTLTEAGFAIEDVIRTRMYVTDMALSKAVTRAHGAVFRHVKPSSTLIQVTALILPELLVEVEVTACKTSPPDPLRWS